MKTIREWLEMLPEPYKSAAIKNAEEDDEDRLDCYVDTLSEAITQGFIWEMTLEGQDYWSELHYRNRLEEAITPKSKEQQIEELKANIAKMQAELDKLEQN